MVAHEMYKEIFKDIGRMGSMKSRALARKCGGSAPTLVRDGPPTGLNGHVLELTDIDTDSDVESITEPTEPSNGNVSS